MSLNFVSTSVLSSTDGVSHDKETNLDPNSSASANQSYQKPLYEQLRENAEREQEKYDEQTRAMRAATTLNEEDVAFIQGVEERKEEIKRNAKQKEEEELQMFRAARLEKTVTQSEIVGVEGIDDRISTSTKPTEKAIPNSKTDEVKITSSLLNMKPKILKKRRRKPEASNEVKETLDSSKKSKACNEPMDKDVDNEKKAEVKNEKPSEVSALGGLLNYSDSDSD